MTVMTETTVKFHVNSKGESAVCHATVGNCPFGESEHFPSKELVDAYIEKKNNGLFGNATHSKKSRKNKTKEIKTGAPIVLTEPNFDENEASWSGFPHDSSVVKEKKNKGEYSEFYAAMFLLAGEEPYYSNGAKPLKIRSMVLGEKDNLNEYRIVHDGDYRDVYIKSPHETIDGKNIAVALVKKEDSDHVFDSIMKGKGRSFHSSAIQAATMKLGFPDGKIPKSTSKADLIAWDEDGNQRRISVKSFAGSNPALINASQQSEMTYTTKIPSNLTESEVVKLISLMENKTTKEKIAALKRVGIKFDPNNGVPRGENMESNFNSLHVDAMKAYSNSVWTAADSKHVMPEELKQANRKVLSAYASQMNHSGFYSDEEKVTDWLFINKNGRAVVHNFSNDEAAGHFFERRVKFNEPDANRHKTGVFNVKNGEIKFTINTYAELSE